MQNKRMFQRPFISTTDQGPGRGLRFQGGQGQPQSDVIRAVDGRSRHPEKEEAEICVRRVQLQHRLQGGTVLHTRLQELQAQ